MYRFMVPAFAVVVGLSALALADTGQCPDFPKPTAEHQWLQALAGEWEYEVQLLQPGQPTLKSKGTETIRSVGGFWTVAENRGTLMDTPFTGFLTLGYDVQRQKFLGTWIDSMGGFLWSYVGSLDKTGKVLTLETEGPCPATGKLVHFRESLEVTSKDTKVFSTAMQAEDGGWTTIVTIDYRRTK